MTRYTNVARKRTYVEAGFNYKDDEELSINPDLQTSVAGSSTQAESALAQEISENKPSSSVQVKKKRKHSKSKKKLDVTGGSGGDATGKGVDVGVNLEGREETTVNEGDPGSTPSIKDGINVVKTSLTTKADKGKKKLKEKRMRDLEARKFSSERRRLKRQDDRDANTICYACRETGHAARNCPKALPTNGLEEGPKSRKNMAGRNAVGICYRCGSRKHNLSRCRASVDSENPLPFASCFVCSETGHLASACPQNQTKGVYPNGGCCKLCGQTTHLAKNCDLRKNEVASRTTFLGTGCDAGADEDDFHTFKRHDMEVSREERGQDRRKRQVDVKRGIHSGVVKSFGLPPAEKLKKVVDF